MRPLGGPEWDGALPCSLRATIKEPSADEVSAARRLSENGYGTG